MKVRYVESVDCLIRRDREKRFALAGGIADEETQLSAYTDNLTGKGVVVSQYATKLNNVTDVAGCLCARDYKGFGRQIMNAVIVEEQEKNDGKQ